MGTEALLARAHGRAGVAGDQDRRCREMPAAQQVDQVESAHSGHMLVDDKTATVRRIGCIQQFSSRGVATDREAFDLEREFQGIANRKIIIQDDDHESRSRQFAMRCHGHCPHWRLDKAVRKQEDHGAALIWLNFTPGRRSTSAVDLKFLSL